MIAYVLVLENATEERAVRFVFWKKVLWMVLCLVFFHVIPEQRCLLRSVVCDFHVPRTESSWVNQYEPTKSAHAGSTRPADMLSPALERMMNLELTWASYFFLFSLHCPASLYQTGGPQMWSENYNIKNLPSAPPQLSIKGRLSKRALGLSAGLRTSSGWVGWWMRRSWIAREVILLHRGEKWNQHQGALMVLGGEKQAQDQEWGGGWAGKGEHQAPELGPLCRRGRERDWAGLRSLACFLDYGRKFLKGMFRTFIGPWTRSYICLLSILLPLLLMS